MGKQLARQFVRMLLLLIGVSLVVFLFDAFIPGDPAQVLAGESATLADIERTREQLGLNRPLADRYLDWAGRAVRGDLGRSLYSSQLVGQEIAARLPVTLSMMGLALLISVIVGIGAGVVAALHRGRWADRAIVLVASLGVAMPNFWVGLMLVLLLAIALPWLPATGYVPLTESLSGWLRHLTLPSLGSVTGFMSRDFVRTATAKGLPRWLVIGKHVLKNTGVTVATVTGIQVSVLLGGSVVIEQVFGLPGIGGLVLEAVIARDLPVVQGIVLVTTLMVLATSLLVEMSYGYFNPRVRG